MRKSVSTLLRKRCLELKLNYRTVKEMFKNLNEEQKAAFIKKWSYKETK